MKQLPKLGAYEPPASLAIGVAKLLALMIADRLRSVMHNVHVVTRETLSYISWACARQDMHILDQEVAACEWI